MLSFVSIKLFFFLLDMVTLLFYLRLINLYKTHFYFVLVLIFGSSCMVTSYINLLNIGLFQHSYNMINDINLNYIVFRFYIYIIEWGQYLLFLKLIVSKKIRFLIVAMIASTLIIHTHYIYIEYMEESYLNISQYISPFHIAWCYFFN